MARLGRFGFLAIAVVFHIVYIFSIFDIYFVSPIVSGMREYGVDRQDGSEAPSKRLVLFVGDGLRADKAFQSFPDPSPAEPSDPKALDPRPLAPFLRSRVLSHGTFGVSHTRVPTESRPGHVALIAGLYEDVSSVTTGWKLNPVNFDSVFNRSKHTWSWGSPDILPMFKEGAVPGRVDADVYGEEAEDYSQDATQLDTWVFDKVNAFFASAANNSTLDAMLRQDKLVFFLHLLGLDTTGHAYRPYSPEYLNNIKIVDKGVQQITQLVESFYGDGKTSYVFTADHGMSDWGSHGDGHPDNTRTPLIAWGSGVAKPIIASRGKKAAGHEDGFSSDWGLDHVARHDVSQADIAALMAYLAGLDFPVNSVGELPLDYLAASPQAKAQAALANTKGILEMYRVKEEHKKSSVLRYQAFPPLSDEETSVEHRIDEISKLIQGGSPEEAIAKAHQLLNLGLDGLRYLQTYDWLFLRALVTLGYLGWIAFALTFVINLYVLEGETETSRTLSTTIAFSSAGVGLFAVLAVQKSPLTYYGYAIFPIFFWEEVYARRNALQGGRKALFRDLNSPSQKVSAALKSLAYVCTLEAMVQAYFHREVFTFFFLLAAFWPAFYGQEFVKQHGALVGTWAIACFFMSTFTLLPVVKVESVNLILISGFLMLLVGIVYLIYQKDLLVVPKPKEEASVSANANGIARLVIGAQTGLIGLAMAVTRSSAISLQAKQGLPLGTQIVGWLVLVTSLAVPFLHGLQPINNYLHRLVIVFLTFSPVFIILTISYEGLFYLAFCAILVTWVRLEYHVYQHICLEAPRSNGSADKPPRSPATAAKKYRALTLSDARIAIFFLFLLQSAFFSTGNIASVSSFSLESVYRLIPVFDPFSQGALLILKLMIPFAILSANLGILNRRLGVAPSALFVLVMAISDVLTLNFFYMVKDEGSWLDIGTTISHFFIASLLCVFVAGLEFVSELFVRGLDVVDNTDDGKDALKPRMEGMAESVHTNG